MRKTSMALYIRPEVAQRFDANRGRRLCPSKRRSNGRDAREGKAPSTQAGEFIKEEIDEIRAGKHGARSTKQAIAIGLSKARRAGVDVPPPKKGRVSEQT